MLACLQLKEGKIFQWYNCRRQFNVYQYSILKNILLLLRGDSLAHGIVGDGPVDGVSAVEVHPLVVLGAVDSNAVLLSGVVRLPLHPVGVGEGLAARVDKGPLSVDVI